MGKVKPTKPQAIILSGLEDGTLELWEDDRGYYTEDITIDREETVNKRTFGILLRNGWIARISEPGLNPEFIKRYAITPAGRAALEEVEE